MKTRLSSLNPLHSIFLPLLVTLVLASCGGEGGSSDTISDTAGSNSDEPALLTGVFIDSPVAGATYATDTQSGTTNDAGEFNYIESESVTFSVGDLNFPSVLAQAEISPVDLALNSNNPTATTSNIARLLQSLDVDGNPDNGIEIPTGAADVATNIDFDVSGDEFGNDPAVITLVANSGSQTIVLISQEQADSHLSETLASNTDGTFFPDDNEVANEDSENYDDYRNSVQLADLTSSGSNVQVADLSFSGGYQEEGGDYIYIDSTNVIVSSSDGTGFQLNKNAIFVADSTCFSITLPDYPTHIIDNLHLRVSTTDEERSSTFTIPTSYGSPWSDGNINHNLRDIEDNSFCVNEPATFLITYINASNDQYTLEIGPR